MYLGKHRWGKRIFFVYCVWMLWLLFGQRLGYGTVSSFEEYLKQSVNLRPFHTIGNYWHAAFRTSDADLLRHIIVNLVGNVIMFVPLGFFLSLNWDPFRKGRILMVTVFGIILSVELTQMVTRLGSFDVDDLILNLVGCAIGYLLWKFLNR